MVASLFLDQVLAKSNMFLSGFQLSDLPPPCDPPLGELPNDSPLDYGCELVFLGC